MNSNKKKWAARVARWLPFFKISLPALEGTGDDMLRPERTPLAVFHDADSVCAHVEVARIEEDVNGTVFVVGSMVAELFGSHETWVGLGEVRCTATQELAVAALASGHMFLHGHPRALAARA